MSCKCTQLCMTDIYSIQNVRASFSFSGLYQVSLHCEFVFNRNFELPSIYLSLSSTTFHYYTAIICSVKYRRSGPSCIVSSFPCISLGSTPSTLEWRWKSGAFGFSGRRNDLSRWDTKSIPRFHFCNHLGAPPETSDVVDMSKVVVKLPIFIGPVLPGFGIWTMALFVLFQGLHVRQEGHTFL